MKILLNLLPEEKKYEIQRNVRFRVVMVHGFGFVILSLFLLCAVFGISRLLLVQLDSLRRPDPSVGAVAEDALSLYEAKFRETNAMSSETELLLERHTAWNEFFRELGIATPEGVLYTHLSVKESYQASFSGRARSREDLLLLERNMNSSSCFRDAVIPLSDKLVKEDIDFQLDAVVEQSCLSKKQ